MTHIRNVNAKKNSKHNMEITKLTNKICHNYLFKIIEILALKQEIKSVDSKEKNKRF